MTFIDNLLGTSSKEWVRDCERHNLDVFGHNIMIMPFQSEGHMSLFVVIGAQNIREYQKHGFSKSRPCILHIVPFESSTRVQCHAYNAASSRIRTWLNVMWRATYCHNDFSVMPFTHRSIPTTRPFGKYPMITATMHLTSLNSNYSLTVFHQYLFQCHILRKEQMRAFLLYVMLLGFRPWHQALSLYLRLTKMAMKEQLQAVKCVPLTQTYLSGYAWT